MSPLGFLRFPTRFCPSLMVPEFVSKERYWPQWLGHGSRWLWRWWHPGHLGRRHGCQSQDVQDVQGKSMKEHERNHRNPLKFIETIPYIPSPDYFIPLHSICFISFSSWMMAAKHFIAPLCHDELGWMTFFSDWVEATNRLCIFLGIRHFGQTSTQFHDPLQFMTAMLDAGFSSFVRIWFVLYSFFFNVLLLRLGGMELVNGGDLDAALGLLNGPGVDANGALPHRTTLCNETQILWSLLVTFKAFLGISRCLNSNFKSFEAQGSILFIIIGPGCGQWWEDRPKDVADSRILSRCLKSTNTKRNLWIIFDTFTSKQSSKDCNPPMVWNSQHTAHTALQFKVRFSCHQGWSLAPRTVMACDGCWDES